MLGGVFTERTRKLLYLPLAYHAAILLALAFMSAFNMNVSSYGILMMLDLAGVIVCPMFMALMGISHAILHGGEVFDYLKTGCIYLAVAGLMRVALYAWQATDYTVTALLCGAAEIGIFLLWEVIFHLTDKMLKKPRKYRGKQRSKGKKKR